MISDEKWEALMREAEETYTEGDQLRSVSSGILFTYSGPLEIFISSSTKGITSNKGARLICRIDKDNKIEWAKIIRYGPNKKVQDKEQALENIRKIIYDD